MPITKSTTSVNKIIVQTTSVDTKGYSWATAWTFDDIVAASDASSWDPPVTKANKVYKIPYSILVMSASTYMSDCMTVAQGYKTFVFCSSTSTDLNQFQVSNSAHFKCGARLSAISTVGGSFFQDPSILAARNRIYFIGDVTLTNCTLDNWGNAWFQSDNSGIASAKNLTTRQISFGLNCNSSVNIDGMLAVGGTYGMQANGDVSGNNLFLFNHSYAILADAGNSVLKNVKIQDCTAHTLARLGTGDRTLKFIDCEILPEKTDDYISGSVKSKVEQTLQTTFSGSISDISGNLIDASVRLYTRDSSLHLEVNAPSGIIPDTIVDYFYIYSEASSGVYLIRDVSVYYDPFKMVVSKPGYADTTITNISVVPGVPLNVNATLLVDVSTGGGSTIFVNQTIDGKIEVSTIDGTVSTTSINGIVTQPSLTAQIIIDE